MVWIAYRRGVLTCLAKKELIMKSVLKTWPGCRVQKVISQEESVEVVVRLGIAARHITFRRYLPSTTSQQL